MDANTTLEIILGDKYYSIEDLRYNTKCGLLFSKAQVDEFLLGKDNLVDNNVKQIEKLPLYTFNSKHCFYVNGEYLQSKYKDYLLALSDENIEQNNLFQRNIEDIYMSKVFSEIEGTLNVENVPTTHKRIKEIYSKQKLSDKNDVIIKNMIDAMSFIVKEQLEFNKDNLFKLYNILSKDCLGQGELLKDGNYYRDDAVYVGGFEGADYKIIDKCMDSLFDFVNSTDNRKKYGIYLPHICHYYILYVHPYFDYNGRTARMVSFWLNYILNIHSAPLFMSEAINDNKNEYYRAITNTRLTNNDLTYFLGYVMETSIKYNLIYKNMESIKERLMQNGDTLTSTEWVYIKKIIVHNEDSYFTYKEFLKYINSNMTKQGALKILNNFAKYGLVHKSTNKKNETIYKINQDYIKYRINNNS